MKGRATRLQALPDWSWTGEKASGLSREPYPVPRKIKRASRDIVAAPACAVPSASRPAHSAALLTNVCSEHLQRNFSGKEYDGGASTLQDKAAKARHCS